MKSSYCNDNCFFYFTFEYLIVKIIQIMGVEIENYNRIAKQLKEEYSKLSDFEILLLAIQIQRNQIIQNGLLVSSSDKHPSALEAIAIALGYEESNSGTITDVLRNIANRGEV